jgi:hypothetical protein
LTFLNRFHQLEIHGGNLCVQVAVFHQKTSGNNDPNQRGAENANPGGKGYFQLFSGKKNGSGLFFGPGNIDMDVVIHCDLSGLIV